MLESGAAERRKEAVLNERPERPERLDPPDRSDRPISRLRRDYRRRPVGWWIAGLVFVLAVMILLPKLLARLG